MVGTPVRLYGALSFYALSIKEKLNTLPSFNHLSRHKEEEVVEEDARDESCDGINGVVRLDIYRGDPGPLLIRTRCPDTSPDYPL